MTKHIFCELSVSLSGMSQLSREFCNSYLTMKNLPQGTLQLMLSISRVNSSYRRWPDTSYR